MSSDFSDLKSVYDHLEEKALDYKFHFQIGEVFQKVRDKMHLDVNTNEETKAQWETDFFNFVIESNTVKPKYTLSNEKGEKQEYPNYDRFNDATYNYLINRLEFTKNSVLKARYAHILWQSPRKHGKYAQIAIDSYVNLIKLYEQKDKEEPNEHYGTDLLNAVKNAYFLSLDIEDKMRTGTIKSEMVRLIFNFNPSSSSFFRLRADLIALVIDEKKVFSKSDFADIEKLCFQFAHDLKDADPHKCVTMLELGHKVDSKLETTTQNWEKLIAEAYEDLMKSRIGKDDNVAMIFCQNALNHYRKANDLGKVAELKKTYEGLRTSAKLQTVGFSIDMSKHLEYCKDTAKKIAQLSSEEIITLLMCDKNLLPKFSEMKTLADEDMKQHHIQDILPTVLSDERGHAVQHFSSDEEKTYYKILENYRMYLEIQYRPLIDAIMYECIGERKITLAAVIEYFRRHSWFGKALKKTIADGREIEFDWLNLIGPSLIEYFQQMEYSSASGQYPVLVCPIDSLVLKVEGLLRDLFGFFSIPTFYQKEDRMKRMVFGEKNLTALLHDEGIDKVFDEDTLLFLRFVLVEQAGYNLRHKTAHSLMFFNEYTISHMNLLILILIKISNFELKPPEGGERDPTVAGDCSSTKI